MAQIVAHMYHFHPCVIVTSALHPGLNYPTINMDLSGLNIQDYDYLSMWKEW